MPKCGGTSLLRHLQTSRLKVFTDYAAYPGGTPETIAASELRKAEVAALDLSSYDLIYGHLPIDRYVDPRFEYVALVRDPVERCLSHYLFRLSLASTKPDTTWGWDLDIKVREKRISFLEYVKTDSCQNSYRRYFCRWDRSRFLLVGTTEKYAEFLAALGALLGIDLPNTYHERRRTEEFALSSKEREAARAALASDYEWYNRFVEAD
jgi:hypothetical protein